VRGKVTFRCAGGKERDQKGGGPLFTSGETVARRGRKKMNALSMGETRRKVGERTRPASLSLERVGRGKKEGEKGIFSYHNPSERVSLKGD